MPRIDAWEENRSRGGAIDLGFRRGLEDAYEWGPELGKGGFGTVRLVRQRGTWEEFACKSICKELKAAKVSEKQQNRHLEMITREVTVLKKLVGTLNVVRLEAVYEDDECVHIIMEYCRGGELWRRVGLKSFGEDAVAKIMRAVLRTLAQCHAHHILHRDVKPGNFMLLTKDEHSPIKAVDFGMAIVYEPSQLPRRDLGFDGTPWFMAPEVLSSEVVPRSDIWSAGVMAYQLLTGFMPFDDRKSKRGPELSKIWKAILTEEPSFTRKFWGGISDEAIDFVRSLLQKNPEDRPTAKEALKHPWVRKGGAKPTQLSETVVQRIQRFGQSSILKRTVLDMIANELIHKQRRESDPDASASALAETQVSSARMKHSAVPHACIDASDQLREERTWHSGMNFKRSSSLPMPRQGPAEQGRAVWQGLAGKARKLVQNGLKRGKNFFSQQDLSRIASTSLTEWHEKRMMLREALDTSVHDGRYFSGTSGDENCDSVDEDELPSSDESLPPSPPSYHITPVSGGLRCDLRDPREGGAFARYYISSEPVGVPFSQHVSGVDSPQKSSVEFMDKCGHGQSHYREFVEAQGGALEQSSQWMELTGGRQSTTARAGGIALELGRKGHTSCPKGHHCEEGSRPKSSLSDSFNREEVKRVLGFLQLTSQGSASVEDVSDGLKQLGYNLERSEIVSLMHSMAPGNDGHVNLSQFLASQMDWQDVQRNSQEEWLECAKQAFRNMDKDADGRVDAQDVVEMLKKKLPLAEVDEAVEQSVVEMCADQLDMDFEGFMKLLRVDSADSLDSLDQYDSRVESQVASGQFSPTLPTVIET